MPKYVDLRKRLKCDCRIENFFLGGWKKNLKTFFFCSMERFKSLSFFVFSSKTELWQLKSKIPADLFKYNHLRGKILNIVYWILIMKHKYILYYLLSVPAGFFCPCWCYLPLFLARNSFSNLLFCSFIYLFLFSYVGVDFHLSFFLRVRY